MQLNKFAVVLLPLVTRICASGIILKSVELDAPSEVDQAAINVLTTCYGNWGNAVGVGGNTSGIIVKTLSSHQIPVVLVGKSTSIAVKFRLRQRIFRYNLQVFVLTASTTSELKKIMIQIWKTVWWNHMASFLILYPSSQGCKNAENVLFLAWRHDLVKAKLICLDRQRGTLILGYNPYMAQAPEPWRLRATVPKHNHFTVFERPYREDKEICNNLDIDKMKNLNGYPVELLYAYHGQLMHTGRRTHLDNNGEVMHNIVGSVLRAMNGTMVPVKIDYTIKQTKPVELNDMMLGTSTLVIGLHSPISRPFLETGLVAMTQHSGHMSQLQKIFSVVDRHSRIGLCIVLVITLVFLKFFVRQALMPGVLNIVRIVCNTGFTNLPQNTPARCYLTGVLFFAVTMQGIYQGNLASLLTNEVPLPNVNTWQDLEEFGYTIYVPELNKELFQDPIFEGRVVPLIGSGDCARYVLNDSSAACVHHAVLVMDQAEELNLHLSDMLKPTLTVYMFRQDWPLEAQFNVILGKLYEADILIPFNMRYKRTTLSDFNFKRDVMNDQNIRIMTLRDLKFAFVILGIGLVCASITFIFEIVINRLRSKNRTRRVHFCNWLR